MRGRVKACGVALGLAACACALALSGGEEPDAPVPPGARRPSNDDELRFWLQNMVSYHHFTPEEITAATGLSGPDAARALERFGITSESRPRQTADAPLLVLPYPGGRHPRIGFLDGAVQPQRDTKFSVFCPWDPSSYVVVDLPEALWSNLGLTYLAHSHIPTCWTKRGITLEPSEWRRLDKGGLESERTLPNAIAFGARVDPQREGVRMQLWLKNGSDQPLSDLRVQICVLLKGAPEFAAQTNDNKVLRNPYVACRAAGGRRWVITAWDPCQRAWANPPCPCLHSDPQFPDCPPGQTRKLNGWLSFYEGDDIDGELGRIDRIDWRHGAD
jgi:hypothetical protein